MNERRNEVSPIDFKPMYPTKPSSIVRVLPFISIFVSGLALLLSIIAAEKSQ